MSPASRLTAGDARTGEGETASVGAVARTRGGGRAQEEAPVSRRPFLLRYEVVLPLRYPRRLLAAAMPAAANAVPAMASNASSAKSFAWLVPVAAP